MRAWVNGELLSSADTPILPVTDHGLTVGDGVFETCDVVDGNAFALSRHLKRLQSSAAGLQLPPLDMALIQSGIDTVLSQPLARGRLRITVTGGPGPMGSARGDEGLTYIVAADPRQPPAESTTIVTAPWMRNERSATTGIKTTSYAENAIALAAAQEAGGSEAVFANTQGNVCEGTGSNIFYVIDGETRTPTLASGCLAGVTRALILEWGDVREVDAPIEVAQNADEVFIASTTRDVQAVRRWDEREYPAPGPVTRQFREIWRENATRTIDP